MTDDKIVKVKCNIISCKNNLFYQTTEDNCGLKYITIGTVTTGDYDHCVPGVCLNKEEA